MLDGRVKTLHPRIHGGLLADRRLADHRRQLLAAGIAPFELVVVNLYPFAAALERPGITRRRADRGDRHRRAVDGPRRRQEPRQRGDRDRRRRATTRSSPRSTRRAGIDDALRRALALEAFAHTAAYDARIAAELPGRHGRRRPGAPDEPGCPAQRSVPGPLTVPLEKVETLRYGENPHQPAARYRRPGTTLADGPFGVERPPLQGKTLSYNNVLDAAAASALGRALRGPGVVIVKHTNPCGAAERPTLLEAWEAAARGRPGQRVRWGRGADPPGRPGGRRAARLDLPRDRGRARLRRRRARGPRHQAEPARAPRRGARARRARTADAAAADRLDPDGRRRGPRHGAGRRQRRRDARGPARPGAPRPTPSSSTSTSPGGWSAA